MAENTTVLQQEGSFSQAAVDLLSAIEKRCWKQAVGIPTREQHQTEWEGVMFYVGEERLVCPLSDVNEILNIPSVLTRAPGTKPWLLGLMNNRGSLLPIIDLQQFLIGQKTQRQRRSRVLVFELANGMAGVLVGDMVGMRHFDEDSATGKKSVPEKFSRYVEYGFDQDGETWPVFKLTRLAEDPAFQNAAV
jgi:twitching motility protein PilI